MELFLKILTYTSAIIFPIAILAGLIYIFVKYGLTSLFQSLVDKIDYAFDKMVDNIKGVFDFLVTEILKITDFIFSRATELSMLINVCLIYQHPPQGDVQYITFCCYLAVNTIVLIKKGNVDIDKITSSLKDIAHHRTNNTKNED